ncbi:MULTISPECIES: flagellar export chaperone FliS [unclassified Cryobacterium]|uniref:flagellar export chaperone FliS n=1 Tax=unclassified Cryobacterium TaxID=2649013 RepID=UPI00106D16E8|nr:MULTISPECIES: flagellar export chaperone FliS [unclassified Cryobacterium]TFD03507.1 flagellar protein FliS [Cryobacterium sp. TMT1-66-1]TFD12770.1 flagellar protein FliS [Cryobacterium sp. TMT1-2-2]
MTMGTNAQRSRYNRDAVLSATPVRLLTMLYDRLLLDLNRAEAAQQRLDWQIASDNLIHAQAIVSELSTSLNVDAWDGGEGLFSLYTYVSTAMVSANTHRDSARTRECISLLEPLRLTWHEAAALLPAAPAPIARLSGELGIG